MNVAYVSALSALAGSVIGGLTTGLTSWLNQRSQAKADRTSRELSRREELYRDFIVAASKAYGDALASNEPPIQELVELYAMLSRMRVLSAERTVSSADKVIVATIDTYFAPNKTVRELREVIKSGKGIDPLGEFSEAARDELRTFIWR